MTQTNTRGFQVGGRDGDLFRGTAGCYAAYRRPYPPPVVDFLVARCGFDGHGRLLDAGCGTGQVFQVMARHFDEVLAIDPDPEMVAHARRAAADLRLDNVTVRQMRAEEIPEHSPPLRAAIFGASFHWTDRPRVGDRIYDLLEPRGHLAVLTPGGIHTGTTEWEAAIRAVVVRHLGPQRRAGGGVYREGERHEHILRRTRFEKIDLLHIPVRQQWSIDEMIGYLFATSFASKAVLGDQAEAFEQDVRLALEPLAPGGQLEKLVQCSVILAQR